LLATRASSRPVSGLLLPLDHDLMIYGRAAIFFCLKGAPPSFLQFVISFFFSHRRTASRLRFTFLGRPFGTSAVTSLLNSFFPLPPPFPLRLFHTMTTRVWCSFRAPPFLPGILDLLVFRSMGRYFRISGQTSLPPGPPPPQNVFPIFFSFCHAADQAGIAFPPCRWYGRLSTKYGASLTSLDVSFQPFFPGFVSSDPPLSNLGRKIQEGQVSCPPPLICPYVPSRWCECLFSPFNISSSDSSAHHDPSRATG